MLSNLVMAELILVTTALFHLGEEVLTGFRKKLPVGEMPQALFIAINFLIYSYAGTMVWLSIRGHERAVWMAWVFGGGMLLNGCGHLGYVLYKRKYFPGGWTATPLCAAAIYLMMVLGLGSGA